MKRLEYKSSRTYFQVLSNKLLTFLSIVVPQRSVSTGFTVDRSPEIPLIHVRGQWSPARAPGSQAKDKKAIVT